MSVEFKKLHLKDNPFRVTPPSPRERIVWAGCKRFKSDLEETIKFSLLTTPSKIVLIHGDWGTGKTHAMRYFSSEETLRILCNKIKIKMPFPINVSLPMSDISRSLYLDIIKSIGIDTLESILKSILSKRREELLKKEKIYLNWINSFVNDIYLTRVFSELAFGKDKLKLSAERYLLLNPKSADLDALRVPTRIETFNDMLRTLSGIFNLISLPEESNYSRVILWIDEIENVKNLSGRDLSFLRSFLRDLLDACPSNLLIFLNITLSPGEDVAEYLQYLGDAVVARLFKRIQVPYLTDEEALEYVRELINNPVYRDPEDMGEIEKRGNLYFPFDENAVRYVIEMLKSRKKTFLAPRWINHALSSALELASRDEILLNKIEKFEQVISKDFIDKNKDKIVYPLLEEVELRAS